MTQLSPEHLIVLFLYTQMRNNIKTTWQMLCRSSHVIKTALTCWAMDMKPLKM